MSIFYYDALPKDGKVDAETNLRRAKAIMARTRDVLSPFYQYLETAIKTLDNKQNIQARWQKVREEGLVKLQPMDRLWRIEKSTVIRLLHNEPGVYRIEGQCDKDTNEAIRYRTDGGANKGELFVRQEDLLAGNKIRLKDAPLQFDSVVWGFDSIQLFPAWAVVHQGGHLTVRENEHRVLSVKADEITLSGSLANGSIAYFDGIVVEFEVIKQVGLPKGIRVLQENDDQWIVTAEQKPIGASEVKIETYLDAQSLRWEHDQNAFLGEKQDSGYLVFQGEQIGKGVGKFLTNSFGLRFKVIDASRDHQVRYWIQLLEKEEDETEDYPGASPLRYFFDDDIEIEDNRGNRYGIGKGYEGEQKLLLYAKIKTSSKREYCYPEGDILKVRVNTYQLRRQKDAVQALQDKPVAGHERLIKLFEDRKVVSWPRPPRTGTEIFWQVLLDEHRNGAKEQREFVRKALNTPDFAILEGPPGSGKTTVILELICQLVMLGKRILLCGSTHVAIDNVLERLQEKKLLEKLSILPVRIGDENRISPAIKSFQMNNLQSDAKIEETLLLEASNLVCGTTIGILQHPDMKQFEGRWEEKAKMPVEPQFDYLIIDECSKTTFHEFLVPALYAKHWILVGDVRQLSPFTDREQLVSNIHQMPLKGNQTLPDELQQACLYLYKLREMTNKRFNSSKYLFVVSQKVMNYVADEWLTFDPGSDFSGIAIGFASMNLRRIKTICTEFAQGAKRKQLPPIVAEPGSLEWMALSAADVLFVEHETYLLHGDHLPGDMTVVNDAKWPERSHAFRVGWQTKGRGQQPFSKDRGTELNGTMEIHEYYTKLFMERTWADEIAWRIDREHQLRLKGPRKTQNYTNAIEGLLPKSLGNEGDVANRLNTIASVALPSILEMLDRGLTKRKTRHESTLTEGFTDREKKARRTLLKYQQRMHPDISAFPRDQFYNNLALQDMDRMAHRREWDYPGYSSRSCWIDVQGKTDRNFNKQEVAAMKVELKRFLEWASENEPPDDGRDNKAEWEVACLSFYRGQEGKIRDTLREMLKNNGSHNETAYSSFSYRKRGGVKISIKLHTVDKFQGQEADLVLLSMVQTYRDGFMDSPNRLNVAITRARYQMVILGNHSYFAEKSNSDDLKKLARHHFPTSIQNS